MRSFMLFYQAEEFVSDRSRFEQTATEWTKKYALEDENVSINSLSHNILIYD